ncbi:MAG TPA: sugar phosphate isomerase/epimerase [Phototrophicaceae bacterium]|nr:sugar phosphate isomerase/epimerase [Phototrophicaceae bacterium]
MKLGVVGVIPNDFDLVDEARAKAIAAFGITGVGAHVGGDPHEMSPERVRRLRDVLADQGIRIIQFWGWYPSIITPDERVRQTGVDHARRIVELGTHAGADMIGIRPTSLSPKGAWSPHRDNYTPEAEDRLVQSLAEIAQASEVHGLPLALECHVTTTLNTPQTVRRVIERTGSQWIKVNIDAVNFVGDFATAFNTTPMLHDLFDTLGEYAAAAHVKDVTVGDDLVVHIDETVPGRGFMDFDTLLSEFEAYLPEGYAFIEHLPEAQIPEALAFVRGKLNSLKIPIR